MGIAAPAAPGSRSAHAGKAFRAFPAHPDQQRPMILNALHADPEYMSVPAWTSRRRARASGMPGSERSSVKPNRGGMSAWT